jgi:hypothetical protein
MKNDSGTNLKECVLVVRLEYNVDFGDEGAPFRVGCSVEYDFEDKSCRGVDGG